MTTVPSYLSHVKDATPEQLEELDILIEQSRTKILRKIYSKYPGVEARVKAELAERQRKLDDRHRPSGSTG